MNRRFFLNAAASTVGLLALGHQAGAQELNEKTIFFDADAPVLGNPDGDVTVVEYFDYQCSYCKKAHPMVDKVVKADGKVRLVLKDWPIFGDPSVYAAQAVLGAAQIGKYEVALNALMDHKQTRISETDVEKILTKAGIGMQEISAAVNKHSAKINGLLDRNYNQAMGFGFRGTPSFVIGRTVFSGMLTEAQLKKAIADARA